LILLILCHLYEAKIISIEDIPNPWEDPQGCCIKKPNSICDPSCLLTSDGHENDMKLLEEKIDHIYKKILIHCDDLKGGVQVSVVVISAMNVNKNENLEDVAKRYAKDLHHKWGVGNKTCNSGIVMFLSIDDRKIFISTGSGARKFIHDDKIKSVTGIMKEKLRSKEYIGAILDGLEKIESILKDSFENEKKDKNNIMITMFFGFLVVFLVAATCTTPTNFRRKLEKIKYEEIQKKITKLRSSLLFYLFRRF